MIREAERSSITAELRRITGHAELRDSFQLQPERDLAIELFWTPGGRPIRPPSDETSSKHRRD